MTIIKFTRHNQPGYFALADLPQRPSLDGITMSTGWPELDELWKLYESQLTVVTGLPSSGKSTFLFNVICNMAHNKGIKSFLYVPENEGFVREKLNWIWGDRNNFDVFEHTQCFIQSSEVNSYDQEPHTLDWVLNKAVTAVKEDGVKVLLIDPWNEIERAKRKDEMMTDFIGKCLMWLKQFARAYSVAVILVAHPTKAGAADGKVPGLMDIEGSMAWWNKSDNGLILARETDKPVTRVISAKVREIGAGKRGVCHFKVDEDTGLFTPDYGGVSL